MTEEILTPEEAAQIFKCEGKTPEATRVQMHRWAAKGIFGDAAFKIGRFWRFRKSRLMDVAKKQTLRVDPRDGKLRGAA